MKFVLDVNMSRSEELLRVLKDGNKIILIDDFFVEILKARNPSSIFENNFRYIKEFPSSLFYAKSRSELIKLEVLQGKPINVEDIICHKNTETIRSLITSNSQEIAEKINKSILVADKIISESKSHSEKLIRNLSKKINSTLDVKNYKDKEQNLANDIREIALTIAEMYLNNNCNTSFDINKFKNQRSFLVLQTYINLWRAMNWSIQKGYTNSKSIVNDNFDVKYILTSCFFDRLLSKEKWMQDCRASAVAFYTERCN